MLKKLLKCISIPTPKHLKPESRKRVLMRRYLAVTLCGCMMMPTISAIAMATEEEPAKDPTGLCAHHPEHTASCSYVEAIAGSPCTHEHDESCGYVAAIAEIPCDMECTDTDSDGIIDHAEGCAYTSATEEKACQHIHDENCGYAAAVEGKPCTFVCEVCDKEEQEDNQIAPLSVENDNPLVAPTISQEPANENKMELIIPQTAPTQGSETVNLLDGVFVQDENGNHIEGVEFQYSVTANGNSVDTSNDVLTVAWDTQYAVQYDAFLGEALIASNTWEFVIGAEPEINKVSSYDALVAAIQKAGNEPTTITITESFELKGYLQIKDRKNITLTSQNGAVLRRSDTAKGNLWVNGELTLKNIMIDGNNISSSYALIYIAQTGKVTLDTGTVVQNGCNDYSQKQYGGGINNIGNLVMNDGAKICGNTAKSYGGGVYNFGIFTMNGGIISDNSNPTWYGGGVYNAGTFAMIGGEITGNSVTNSTYGIGGGVYNTGKFTATGGEISSNINGGVVLSEKTASETSLTNIKFQDNTGNQAVLSSSSKNKVKVTGCTFIQNYIINNSIVYFTGTQDECVLENCTFEGNKAEKSENNYHVESGCIIFSDLRGTPLFQNCTLKGNESIGIGASIFNISSMSGTTQLEGCRIIGNTAQACGGIFKSAAGAITLKDTIIAGNVSTGERAYGGIHMVQGTLDFQSGAIYQNTNTQGIGFVMTAQQGTRPGAVQATLIPTSEMKDPEQPGQTFSEHIWKSTDGMTEGKLTFQGSGNSRDPDYYVDAVPKTNFEGIFISGVGNDENDGASPDAPVRTLEKALELRTAMLAENAEMDPVIYVVGTLNISQDTEWDGQGAKLMRYPVTPFISTMVNVSEGTLTLKDIVLDGASEYGTASNGALIKLYGGNLILDDGAVLQNNTKTLGNKFEGGAGVYASNGNITMKSGSVIQNNCAHNGAGISLMGSSHLSMQGGAINNNTTDRSGNFGVYDYSSGGGVFIAYDASMEMTDGVIYGNTAYDGGGISLGGPENDVFIKNHHPTFTMLGGRIEDNSAYSNGGGIWVQSNCTATIEAGSIVNNHFKGNAAGSNIGGAGIYVNGGKGGYTNGLLQLYNVEISDNAAGNGTAISGCPTSNTKIYLTNGGIIHENIGTNDISLVSGNLGGYTGIARAYISPFMLGGGAYHWTDNDGNELPLNNGFVQINNKTFYAKTDVAGDALTGLGKIKTYITGNYAEYSRTPGGAIGSNGDVIIGTADEMVSLDVTKTWNDAEAKKQPDYKRPEYIDIRIGAGIETNEDGSLRNPVDVGFVRLNEANDWKATLNNLPKRDENGNDFIYTVAEVVNGFDSVVTDISAKDVDGKISHFQFTIENTPTYALKIAKKAEGPAPANADFGFSVTLTKGGAPFTGEIKTINQAGAEGTLSFTNGTSVFTLKANEWIQLLGLLPDMTYTATETDAKGAENTEIEGNITDNIALGGNEVIFTNIFDTPDPEPQTGSLTIRKTVTGVSTEKPFTFILQLTPPAGANLDGITFSDNNKVTANGAIANEYVVTLKADETLVVSGLPQGTQYNITEIEAAGYTVTLRNQDGTPLLDALGNPITAAEGIVNESNMSPYIEFVNHKPEIQTQFGSLVISKTVSGNRSSTQRDFTFTVTLRDANGNLLTGVYPYTGSHEGHVEGGTATFLLRHGQSITISGLPAGTAYEVSEEAGDYSPTVSNPSGVITADAAITVAFDNYRNGGGGGGRRPTPTPDTEIDEPPIPQVYYPGEEPDPNELDSPDEITIVDDDVPQTYIKTWDPENEEYVYIPEEPTPLAPMTPTPIARLDITPKTDDPNHPWFWLGLCFASILGIGLLKPRKKHDEK